jgi:hypothetical protein
LSAREPAQSDAAFVALARQRVDALLVVVDSMFCRPPSTPRRPRVNKEPLRDRRRPALDPRALLDRHYSKENDVSRVLVINAEAGRPYGVLVKVEL